MCIYVYIYYEYMGGCQIDPVDQRSLSALLLYWPQHFHWRMLATHHAIHEFHILFEKKWCPNQQNSDALTKSRATFWYMQTPGDRGTWVPGSNIHNNPGIESFKCSVTAQSNQLQINLESGWSHPSDLLLEKPSVNYMFRRHREIILWLLRSFWVDHLGSNI